MTREEDINIGNGDEFVPAVPPSACAGALHTVDSSGNATFPGGPGTSPYEGLAKPLCDVKLVSLSNGKSIAPTFNIFTDVPLPGRHWFIIIDDLNFSSNPKSITYGEKAGMPFVPIGIYDYTDRLIKTVEIRLQRPGRCAAALDQPHQLPDALGCLHQPVSLRGQ